MRSQENLRKIYVRCLGREGVDTVWFQEKMDILKRHQVLDHSGCWACYDLGAPRSTMMMANSTITWACLLVGASSNNFFSICLLCLARVETNVDSNDKGRRILEGLLQRSKDTGGFHSDSWQWSAAQEVSKVLDKERLLKSKARTLRNPRSRENWVDSS